MRGESLRRGRWMETERKEGVTVIDWTVVQGDDKGGVEIKVVGVTVVELCARMSLSVGRVY